uniref:Neuropeptide-like 1, isoform C n=1 Tax=Drosophila melanogaster TaxID=7227 RepID=B7YZQ9_DROME|nr:Neuropeptide-like precursor 1, isoform C [Drosophila melanogaster]ACL83213.1 Neuropeptide-like precursor 1, isoform C [Drosophila melanogaster]|eukprot:NP_001137760.1 Neuropeptide-like precursor 1, isoform C [Drosophila melanogaster]
MQAVLQSAHSSRRLMLLLSMLLNAAIQPRSIIVSATDDVANVSPCEMESLINQLMSPSPEYQLHASALRNQLKNLLRERQLAVGEEQPLGEYPDYLEEDKRSVAALAAQGLLNAPKRSLATLAKNGQLPTAEPGEDYGDADSGEPSEQKRYIGSLARAGGLMTYGKRNVGTLARDFQLPIPNGKRNIATMARLQSAPSTHRDPKRNVAAVARYNSQHGHIQRAGAEKRNLGALKSSPVHGVQQKREDEEMLLPAAAPDYADPMQSYWWYPSYAGYADLDWNDYRRAEKRFLDTSKDPELFGIEHGNDATTAEPADEAYMESDAEAGSEQLPSPQKRHIGAVYRSGFLPSYRYLRSPGGSSGFGGAGGRFSRSGRDARQFAGYFHQHERLRQPTAAVCKQCFIPNQPMINWSGAGVRGRLSNYYVDPESSLARLPSLSSNSLPSGRPPRPLLRSGAPVYPPFHTWGTPPRITALHRREFRRNSQNYEY